MSYNTCDPFTSFLWYCGTYTEVLTQTLRTQTGNQECVATSSSGYCRNSGTVELQLSEEDTDDDAIVRLINSSTWSGWTSCPGVPPPCCLVYHQLRTIGFSFAIILGQFRCRAAGLEGGKTYSTNVNVYRRLYGSSDAFALYQSLNMTSIAAGDGTIEFDGDIPNDLGFETYVAPSPCEP